MTKRGIIFKGFRNLNLSSKIFILSQIKKGEELLVREGEEMLFISMIASRKEWKLSITYHEGYKQWLVKRCFEFEVGSVIMTEDIFCGGSYDLKVIARTKNTVTFQEGNHKPYTKPICFEAGYEHIERVEAWEYKGTIGYYSPASYRMEVGF